jgi:hypothetical protein
VTLSAAREPNPNGSRNVFFRGGPRTHRPDLKQPRRAAYLLDADDAEAGRGGERLWLRVNPCAGGSSLQNTLSSRLLRPQHNCFDPAGLISLPAWQTARLSTQKPLTPRGAPGEVVVVARKGPARRPRVGRTVAMAEYEQARLGSCLHGCKDPPED